MYICSLFWLMNLTLFLAVCIMCAYIVLKVLTYWFEPFIDRFFPTLLVCVSTIGIVCSDFQFVVKSLSVFHNKVEILIYNFWVNLLMSKEDPYAEQSLTCRCNCIRIKCLSKWSPELIQSEQHQVVNIKGKDRQQLNCYKKKKKKDGKQS